MDKIRAMIAMAALAAAGTVGFVVPVETAPETVAAGASLATPPALAPGGVIAGRVDGAGEAERTAKSDAESALATERAAEPALTSFTGSSSYYADRFEGRTTASGVRFRQAKMWAAHRTLPFGTRLRVTNISNGREVEVEVVDRGPYAHGRILDLSRTAARRLDFIRAGHTKVRIEVLEKP